MTAEAEGRIALTSKSVDHMLVNFNLVAFFTEL